MSKWQVIPGLEVLIRQLKTKYLGVTIGTIGDLRHQTEVSDHNPDRNGNVCAADVMISPSFTPSNADSLVWQLTHNMDTRLHYVIWDGHIYRDLNGYRAEIYHGTDPHISHVHISTYHNAYKTEPWVIAERKFMFENVDGSLPILHQGDKDPIAGVNSVSRAQKILGVEPDGDYGPKTSKAVADLMNTGNGQTIDKNIWRRIYGIRPKV